MCRGAGRLLEIKTKETKKTGVRRIFLLAWLRRLIYSTQHVAGGCVPTGICTGGLDRSI